MVKVTAKQSYKEIELIVDSWDEAQELMQKLLKAGVDKVTAEVPIEVDELLQEIKAEDVQS